MTEKADSSNFYNFSQFCLKRSFSDFIIKVDKENIYSHKIILASRSTYFHVLFNSNTENFSELTENDVSPEAVRCVLQHIYTGSTNIKSSNEDEILAVLKLAHKYTLSDLETTLLKEIKSIINLKNISAILNTANFYDISELRDMCHGFIEKRISDISKSNCLNDLSKKSLSNLVREDYRFSEIIPRWQISHKNVDSSNIKLASPTFLESLKDAIKKISLETQSETLNVQDKGGSSGIIQSQHKTIAQKSVSKDVVDKPKRKYSTASSKPHSVKRRASPILIGPITRSRTIAQKQSQRPKTTAKTIYPKLPNKEETRKNTKKEKVIRPVTNNKQFKVFDLDRERKLGIVALSFNELVQKAKEKFKLSSDVLTVVLEDDGTEITDEEYFSTLEKHTSLMVLETNQKWVPPNNRQELDVDTVDSAGDSQSELMELIAKLKSNMSHLCLLKNAQLELLADMDPISVQFCDKNFLVNIKEASERYLTEKRQAQDAIDFLKLYRKHKV